MGLSRSYVCARARARVSLALDGELPAPERALLDGHLARCPACRAFQADVSSLAAALRQAPLERRGQPYVLRRPRRPLAAPLRAGMAAAVVAVAAFGVADQLAPRPSPSPQLPALPTALRFPSEAQLEQEQALLDLVRRGKQLPAGGRVRVK
jgi:anti-sigma factor RsiW